jgi:uncharacterized protein with von Willebrand factor type A (vWA) domain
VPESLLANLLMFARTLRGAGVAVRAGGVPDAIRALEDVGISSRRDVHDALRAVLVSRHEDLVLFDRIFERFWRVWREPSDRPMPQPMGIPKKTRATVKMLAPGASASEPQASESDQHDEPVTLQSYSAGEVWRRKDFATFTAADFARARDAIAQLTWNPGVRLTRRWSAGGRGAVDLRRVLRANLKHGGELIAVPHRRRRIAPRPLILICDVSGSMEPYTRMLLLFAHALAGGHRRIEVFVFSTRLTRVTRQFAGVRPDAALLRVRDAVRDWSGGTRMGAALHRFNTHWARRVLRRGPVALLISDGWDLGDPALLGREVARLQRSVHRLIWLNPLIGSPGYEPLTRGTRAALPFVDDFLSVRDMSSLESLARHLNTLE